MSTEGKGFSLIILKKDGATPPLNSCSQEQNNAEILRRTNKKGLWLDEVGGGVEEKEEKGYENSKRKSISGISKKPAKSKKAKVESEIENGGKNVKVNNLNVPRTLSLELSLFVGACSMGRTDINRIIWAYIKKTNLQDINDLRIVNLDSTLQAIFGADVKSLNMLELPKHLKKHMIVPEAPEGKVSKKVNKKSAAAGEGKVSGDKEARGGYDFTCESEWGICNNCDKEVKWLSDEGLCGDCEIV